MIAALKTDCFSKYTFEIYFKNPLTNSDHTLIIVTLDKAMIRISSSKNDQTESSRLMRGAWETYCEYIFELRTEHFAQWDPYTSEVPFSVDRISRLRRHAYVIMQEYMRLRHQVLIEADFASRL